MIPAENPVLAITVIVDEPRGAIFGGVVAAPIFREIAANPCGFWAIIPRTPKDKNEPVLASMLASPAAAATSSAVGFTPPKLEIPHGPLTSCRTSRGTPSARCSRC